jgi:hypothetical protein
MCECFFPVLSADRRVSPGVEGVDNLADSRADWGEGEGSGRELELRRGSTSLMSSCGGRLGSIALFLFDFDK